MPPVRSRRIVPCPYNGMFERVAGPKKSGIASCENANESVRLPVDADWIRSTVTDHRPEYPEADSDADRRPEAGSASNLTSVRAKCCGVAPPEFQRSISAS